MFGMSANGFLLFYKSIYKANLFDSLVIENHLIFILFVWSLVVRERMKDAVFLIFLSSVVFGNITSTKISQEQNLPS